MIPLDDSSAIWAVGILCFALGTILGCIASYLFIGRDNETVRLQHELSELRKRFSDHRDKVAKHFMHTSDLVQEMTQSYRAVYEHLATGARELCDEDAETSTLDSADKELLAEDVHRLEAGYDEAVLGDTPRISDLKIRVDAGKSLPRRH